MYVPFLCRLLNSSMSCSADFGSVGSTDFTGSGLPSILISLILFLSHITSPHLILQQRYRFHTRRKRKTSCRSFPSMPLHFPHIYRTNHLVDRSFCFPFFLCKQIIISRPTLVCNISFYQWQRFAAFKVLPLFGWAAVVGMFKDTSVVGVAHLFNHIK